MSTNPNVEVQPGSPRATTPVVAPRASLVQEQSVLGKTLVVRGEITGNESLHVLGEFEGSIALPGCYVQVGPNGAVSSNVTAREVVICGKLRGNLNVDERVDLRKGATLTGDVVARSICIEEGAFFKGSIDMRPADVKSGPKPAASPSSAIQTPPKPIVPQSA
ncbi:MAG: polymer-forming cytoskeletal protein [Terriglobales bacterium]